MDPVTVPARPTVNRVLPPRPKQAAVVVLAWTALLYLIELVDVVGFDGRLDRWGGIQPLEVSGLDGVLFAPLLHAGWDHLAANTLPFLVLGFLAMSGGLGQFVAVTAVVWLVGGLGTWVGGGSGYHVGASGLIFGWLAFLLVRGFFARSVAQILLAVALFLYYGYMLWGVLPTTSGVSWQGHLFGAVGGVLAAWLVARADRPGRRRPSGSVRA
ncbi:rhomboid family intramembrane serine protease [Streptoalloteichus tenebrarius]|uniref:rhomboid family intramembrane serine protease n=1 Tax=Streptoalloteichus tenebrarius (strain ATCC 17920 / DSM 40477 / JCM 4838 / CBS 697.72 / NBRC 16177 / NCIMB 11028 / NRRL B-12390 / A12253. 1 / ISP 5477) TaxID=1933 RepID=UPI0020A42192|nr:rhomboid family intramembrane serine protease [Streptoalloteichus tenebrarius]